MPTKTKSSPTRTTTRTTHDQVSAVRSAAFFDLDGTLIPGSANIPLAKAAFRQGFVSKRELFVDLRNGVSFLLKGATDERSAQVRDRILFAVQGHKAADIESLSDDFMADLTEQLRPAMRTVLADQAMANRTRIVLSASPTEIVSRFAESVGMDEGIGTTAARDDDGVYNGELVGPFCYKKGKAEIIQQLAAERGYDLEDSYAYSDSLSDIDMLEAVGHPVAVNPEPELRELAMERGWEIIETSSVPRVKLKSVRGVATLATNVVKKAARTAKLAVSSRLPLAA